MFIADPPLMSSVFNGALRSKYTATPLIAPEEGAVRFRAVPPVKVKTPQWPELPVMTMLTPPVALIVEVPLAVKLPTVLLPLLVTI